MMKPIVSTLLFFTVFSNVFFAGPIDKIAALLQQGQAHELAKQFAASMEFSILDDEKDVSKAQAETLLTNFFTQNKPVSVKVIHRIETNPSLQYAVVQLRTSNGNFRVSYSLKITNGNQEITDLHIEAEKGQ
ncbi:DUF4783 domain-containing protein [Mucilaginibacter arboris]|uniref:DUF4783 domain-containing protein n=1 Tax=Mucilaginibacter arboris TaxID=2682090 RepID=A0A7K1SUF7_9SPHI|nr:DUF4783 domain-containing protein [Mucilaginibacter arboris]MVN20897.1 DUF4783 domain-containing protein [Mucilaginibacter arboris]